MATGAGWQTLINELLRVDIQAGGQQGTKPIVATLVVAAHDGNQVAIGKDAHQLDIHGPACDGSV